MTLPPVPWARHLWVPSWVASAAVSAWWWVLQAFIWVGVPSWAEGPLWLGAVAAAVAASSLMLDGWVRGRARWLVAAEVGFGTVLVGAGAFGLSALWMAAVGGLAGPVGMSVLVQPDLLSLRGQLGAFVAVGGWTGIVLGVIRAFPNLLSRWWPAESLKDEGAAWVRVLEHVFAGIVSGGAWAGVWFVPGFALSLAGDQFIAGALSSLTFGLSMGFLAWTLPDRAWTPWIRVRRGPRKGMRVPLLGENGEAIERFVGHYPRGLDLFLPSDTGASEVHLSALVDGFDEVVVRGQSVSETVVSRFLETVDLAYDPSAAAPVETVLSPGDIVRVGTVELEVLYLPQDNRP